MPFSRQFYCLNVSWFLTANSHITFLTRVQTRFISKQTRLAFITHARPHIDGVVRIRGRIQPNCARFITLYSQSGSLTNGIQWHIAGVVMVNEVTEHSPIRKWNREIFNLQGEKKNKTPRQNQCNKAIQKVTLYTFMYVKTYILDHLKYYKFTMEYFFYIKKNEYLCIIEGTYCINPFHEQQNALTVILG